MELFPLRKYIEEEIGRAGISRGVAILSVEGATLHSWFFREV